MPDPVVTVRVWFVSMLAPPATTTSTVTVSSSTGWGFCSERSGLDSPTVAPVRLRPRSVTGTVCPGSPAPGVITVTLGTVGGTTKNSIVVCPLSVVTISRRASDVLVVAPGSMVRVAVRVVSSGVALPVIAMPLPVDDESRAAEIRTAQRDAHGRTGLGGRGGDLRDDRRGALNVERERRGADPVRERDGMRAEVGRGVDRKAERQARAVRRRCCRRHGHARARHRDAGRRDAREPGARDGDIEGQPGRREQRRRHVRDHGTAHGVHGEAHRHGPARRGEREDALARRRGRFDREAHADLEIVRRLHGRDETGVAEDGDGRAGERATLDRRVDGRTDDARGGKDSARRGRARGLRERRQRQERQREREAASPEERRPCRHGSAAVRTSNEPRASFEYAVTTRRSRPSALKSPFDATLAFAAPDELGKTSAR